MSEKISEPAENVPEKPDKPSKAGFIKSKKFLTSAAIIVAALLLIPSSYLAFAYSVSPEAIRKPVFDHYHFRMQIIVDGKEENFAEPKYQQEYAKDLCTANITEAPVHFHDNKNQMTHIHWNGMTGGLVMKDYGWNFIGGPDSVLGYRMDNLPMPKKVPIHGKLLPTIPSGSNFYVYVGDEKSYSEKSFDDWKNKDLEEFFGKYSNLPGNPGVKSSFITNFLFPKASAHGAVDDGHTGSTEEELTRINNLIGNVVIFVQKEKPSDQQIKDRFAHLEPLSDSTCGG